LGIVEKSDMELDEVCPHDGCNWRDEARAQIGGLMAVNKHFRCGV
jgi:hypothetical protein